MIRHSALSTQPSALREATPRFDPYCDQGPINPCRIGGDAPIPTDSASLADHLEPLRPDPDLLTARQLLRRRAQVLHGYNAKSRSTRRLAALTCEHSGFAAVDDADDADDEKGMA